MKIRGKREREEIMNENLESVIEAVCGFFIEMRGKATFSMEVDKAKK